MIRSLLWSMVRLAIRDRLRTRLVSRTCAALRTLLRTAPLLVAPLLLTAAPPVGAAALVHGPWLEDVRPDGVTVVWELDELLPTDGPDAPRVELGADPAYGRTVPATAAIVQYAWPVYRARIDGLPPGTGWHYRVRAGALATEDATFRTAPQPGATGFRWYVLGDSRSDPARFAGIAARVRTDVEERPERNQTFAVSVGDIVYHGILHDEYGEQWFGPAAPLLARLPVLIAFGNHEDRNDPHRSDLLLRGWFRDGGPKWTALAYGGLHLTVLALWDAGGFTSGPQADWLAATLAAAAADPDLRWRVAAMHETPWTVGGNGADVWPAPDLRAHVHPRLRDAGVTAAFGGHNHLYARYEPIEGVHYLTTGSSGTPVDTRTWSAWPGGVLARQAGVAHWAAVDVEDDSLTVRVYDESDALVDALTVGRDPADRPPLAAAGPDQALAAPGTLWLDGRGSSDPEGAALAWEWTQVAGPAPARIGGADGPEPKVSLDGPGRWVFALRVSDGRTRSAPDHVVVVVEGAPEADGGTTAEGGIAGDAVDGGGLRVEPLSGGGSSGQGLAVPVEDLPFDLRCAAAPGGPGPRTGAAGALLLAMGALASLWWVRRRVRRRRA